MSSLTEKLQREIDKSEAERLAAERDIHLDPNDPANREKIRAARNFQRKTGAAIFLVGLALVGLTYGFYVYTGDLYLILGLLGGIALVVGLYQTVVGKSVGKSK